MIDITLWFSLINQVASFLTVAVIVELFRELLKKPAKRGVYYDDTLDAIFKSTKKTIKNLVAVLWHITPPQPHSQTAVAKEMGSSSCSSIGNVSHVSPHVLCKRMENYTFWQLPTHNSRKKLQHLKEEATHGYLVPQESLFLLDCMELTFVTDHKDLTKIFNDKELKSIKNPYILNLKERTLMYNFCMRQTVL